MKKIILFCAVTLTLIAPIKAQNPSWFSDVTAQIGSGGQLDTVWNFRIYAVDVNNDDYPDLMLEYGNMDVNQLRLFMNVADVAGPNGRKFLETTATSGINLAGKAADMATIADFNNDGNVDFITNVWVNECNDAVKNAKAGLRIFMGQGNGTFTYNPNSGLSSIPVEMPGSGLPVLDFDKDGNLDFFVATHWKGFGGGCNGNPPGDKYLMKGNGDGTFTHIPTAGFPTGNSGSNVGIFGANVADWNNDCNQDILYAPYTTSGYGQLFKNNGNSTFSDVGTASGYNVHFAIGNNGAQGMVPWEAMPYDYDNDGDIDFLVPQVHGGTNANSGKTAIFTNKGPAFNYSLVPEPNRITRVNPQGNGFGHYGDHKAIWTDFDNDGLVDLVISEGGYAQANVPSSERLYFCRQNASNNFTDVTPQLGFITGAATSATDIATNIRTMHALEPLDFDLDGDDDIVVGSLYSAIKNKRFLVLKNDIGNTKSWLKIKLVAPNGVNKSCIGARIKLKSGGKWHMRDISAGEGHFGGQQPFALNFGLDANTVVDSIVVKWPNSICSITTLTNVSVNQFITITGTNVCSPPTYPGSIAGSMTVCPSASNVYSVFPVNGATSYTWTLPNGWTGTSATNSISITTGTASGMIGVSATNSCGTSPSTSLAINIITNNPGLISGTTTACTGVSSYYSISPVIGAVSYTWTLPNGWTGTSSTGGINITPGSNAGVVTVAITNSCGVTASSSLSVNVANCSVGINQYVMNGFDSYLNVYPNPNKGFFFIDYKNNPTQLNVSVNNLLGQEVYSSILNPNLKNEIRLPENKGMYFLKIYDSKNHLVLQKKIIIE